MEIDKVMPIAIFHYVCATRTPLLLTEEEVATGPFRYDPYFLSHTPKSCLCAPTVRHGSLSGLLYVENDYASATFSSSHVQVLQLLCSQAAISLENAILYQSMKQARDEAEIGLRSKSEFLSSMSHGTFSHITMRLLLHRIYVADFALSSSSLSLFRNSYSSGQSWLAYCAR